MISYEPLDYSDQSFKQYSSFLCSIFKKTTAKSFDYLKWEYLGNPLGNAQGFNAYDKDKLIGHYVAQPIKSTINGEIQSGLFALHVAVDDQYRGKGIFAEINNRTHELAKRNGFRFVIGVANDNSTYVYTKKLGFSLVTPLSTQIGFTFPLVTPNYSEEFDYNRIWNNEILKWRLRNPNVEYFYKKTRDGIFILCKTGKFGIYAIVYFIPKTGPLIIPNNIQQLKVSVPFLKVWFGLNPNFKWTFPKHLSIPQGLKPSPLNLIFLSFSNQKLEMFSEKINFNPIDHDAF